MAKKFMACPWGAPDPRARFSLVIVGQYWPLRNQDRFGGAQEAMALTSF
jgi:hypothetical protein